MREERKRFFFEKKKQKTSVHWSLAQAPRIKVFWFFFSKKNRFLPSFA
jgi:hypothetical protein